MSGAAAAESAEGNENETGQEESGQVSQEETTSQSSDSTKGADSNPPNEDSSNEGEVEYPHKPEWLNERIYKENFEKYGDKLDMGKVAEYFSKQNDNAQNLLNQRKDVIKEQVAEEFRAERMEGVPENSMDYEFNKLILADDLGLEVNVSADDPLMIAAKTWAHKHNLKQADFDELMEMHLHAVSSFFPDWENEKVRLGDHADERHRSLNAWAGKVLAPEVYQALNQVPLSADLIVVLEAFQELSGTKPFDAGSGETGNTMITRDDILKMMDTDEYRNGDKATLQKVAAAWKRLGS